MRLKNCALLCGAIAAAVIAGGSLTASADPIGGFVVTTPGNTYQYVQGSPLPVSVDSPSFFFTTTDTADATPGYIDVNFHYEVANGTGLVNVNIPAEMLLTAEANVPTNTSSVGGGTFLNQPLTLLDLSITATTDDGAHGITGNEGGPGTGSNLLTAYGTGSINGFESDTVGNTAGDSLTGDSVTFTSDFLNTGSFSNESWNIALDSISPPLDDTPALAPATVGIDDDAVVEPVDLNSFTAAGDGTFASSVPEPTTLGLLGIGMAGLMLQKKRRKAVGA